MGCLFDRCGVERSYRTVDAQEGIGVLCDSPMSGMRVIVERVNEDDKAWIELNCSDGRYREAIQTRHSYSVHLEVPKYPIDPPLDPSIYYHLTKPNLISPI